MRIALEGLSATVGPTDGAARYLTGLTVGLSQNSQIALTVFHGPSMHNMIDAPDHVTFRLVGGPKRIRRVTAQHVLVPEMARKWGADAVIYTGNYCPVFTGPPAVVVVQNMLLIDGTYDFGYAVGLYRRWQIARIARHAARIIAVSQFLADALAEKFPSLLPKLRVVTSGVDERFFLDHADGPDESRWHPCPYFLCVGTAWPYRDYELAIAALAQSRLQYDLVIAGAAGPSDRKRLLEYAEHCKMPGKVVMIGCIDTNSMRAAYRDASALVATSRIESFALSILEAMAVGCPVVAVQRTVYPETVSGAGLLCNPTAKDLAEGMRAVIEPKVRNELIVKGRKRVARARWSESAAKIKAIVGELGPRTG